MGEKLNPREVALTKDCIVLVGVKLFISALPQSHLNLDDIAKIKVKCTGPECGQFNEFVTRCGFTT